MSALILRHGTTALNAERREEDRARGHEDIPLAPEGVRVAHAAAQRLKHVPIADLTTSDLLRARQTAQIWYDALPRRVPFTADPHLRPWNVGQLAGHLNTEIQPIVESLLTHPYDPAPGGESFHTFLARLLPYVLQLIADPLKLHGIVAHSTVIKALEAYLATDQAGFSLPVWRSTSKIGPGQAVYIPSTAVHEIPEAEAS